MMLYAVSHIYSSFIVCLFVNEHIEGRGRNNDWKT